MHRKMHFYTRLCTVFTFFCAYFSTAYALPGVTQYIPDSSGEYVYYRDYSFNRESYTGFLYYDDGTYAARYYAPADFDQQLPPKAIELLISIDPTASHIEMTGERIISATHTEEDNDIINYLHDMIYELTARRQKIGLLSPEQEFIPIDRSSFHDAGIIDEQEFLQFGGDVTLLFDYIVPLFNLRHISSSDGELQFELVTAGRLKSSQDTSFSNFTGIPFPLNDQERKFILNKKAKEVVFSYSNKEPNSFIQSVRLDTQWTASMEQMYMLDNYAYTALSSLSVPSENRTLFFNSLLRKLLLSVEGSYCIWDTVKLEFSEQRIMISCQYYQNGSNAVTRDFKTITQLSDDMYGWFSLTVFDSVYRKNHTYFDAIIDSYAIGSID
ncbi:MAG: hypothetical protein K6E51_03985 [Treponema sp.]|nr:hypothetical protein [Treponema sp.]